MRHPLTIVSASLLAFGLYACTINQAPANAPGPANASTAAGTKTATKGTPTSKGKKGGSGKDAPGGGGKASSLTLAAAAASGNKDEADNDCKGVADGDALCKGSSISLCSGEQEYFLECGAFAQSKGWDTGDCFETDATTDCFGCDQHDDGSAVCCDVDENDTCCDEQGNCWKP